MTRFHDKLANQDIWLADHSAHFRSQRKAALGRAARILRVVAVRLGLAQRKPVRLRG